MKKPIRRALVSVYDKDRLIEIGKALSTAGIEILSTGSTAKNLADAGIAVTEVSAYTGFPEIMGGRVKTLHPRVHGGILAEFSVEFLADMSAFKFGGNFSRKFGR